MSDTTKIEWATATFNPWIGCTKVSPGCAHCYAEARDARLTKGGKAAHWGKGAPRQRTSAATWRNPVKWNKDYAVCARGWEAAGEAESDGLPIKRELAKLGMTEPQRPRVFPSLCDWLDEEVPIDWLADFLKLIHDTPHLDWLLLTKRPGNFEKRVRAVCTHFAIHGGGVTGQIIVCGLLDGRMPSNVWLGVSVEDQQRAEERIPELLRIPARVRFLSVEPLLEPVNLDGTKGSHDGRGLCWDWVGNPTHVPHGDYGAVGKEPSRGAAVDWVIVGGESGPKARPCNVEWIRSIVRQCAEAGVPCFVKQLGSNARGFERSEKAWLKHPKGGDPSEWPAGLRVREFPKLP